MSAIGTYISNDLSQLDQAKMLVKGLVTNPLQKSKLENVNKELLKLVNSTPVEHKTLGGEYLKLQFKVKLLEAAFEENNQKETAALIREIAHDIFPSKEVREKLEAKLQQEAQMVNKGADVKESHSKDKKEQKSVPAKNPSSSEALRKQLDKPKKEAQTSKGAEVKEAHSKDQKAMPASDGKVNRSLPPPGRAPTNRKA